ncbi:hypothetical protein [Sphingomonas bacterium]|uniref:hypothetical protein n=1 Tax=Sphingomonas bacterium TaxID=1895847 RepID=UPI0015753872|nr:hypothetical protein [Sphingomonas bacterium]
MQSALDDEVDGNFDAFHAILPQLLQKHIGQFALLRHQVLEECFVDLRSAFEAGSSRFADQLFSVQEVTDRPADLGFFSHAVDTRIA